MRFCLPLTVLIIACYLFCRPIDAYPAGPAKAKLAILDLSQRNNETNGYLYASKQMAAVAGVPYQVTTSVSKAAQCEVIMLSHYLDDNTFSPAERGRLLAYVRNGGVLLGSDVKDAKAFYNLFGIQDAQSSNKHFRLRFLTGKDTTLFQYFNHPREKTISLGDSTGARAVYASHYTTRGEPLAYLGGDPDKPAFTRHQFQSGYAYAMGISFRDLVLRPMLNKDFSAERVSSNGFEPSAGVMGLLLRSLCARHMDALVWKHTSPGRSLNTVMVTHDVDSRTGFDTMGYFARSEYQQGIRANYNITTRYFEDEWLDSFYSDNKCPVDKVKTYGHSIGSHSVGHFIDFDSFSFGPSGLKPSQYQPRYNGTTTTNGYILPEVEVSKDLLRANHNVEVEGFRAGHLRYPDQLGKALDSAGYRYNSSVSSNAILYNWPFPVKGDRSFDGAVTSVYEMPITISDVLSDSIFRAGNFQKGVKEWTRVYQQYADNYAPVNLLVHPNRRWKWQAQQQFLNLIGNKHAVMAMDAYGNFWRKRANLDFAFEKAGPDSVIITLPQSAKPLPASLSFGIEGLSANAKVGVQYKNGSPLNYQLSQVPGKPHLILSKAGYQPGKPKRTYVKPPFKDDFEGVDSPLKEGWEVRFPANTHNLGNFNNVRVAGVKLKDTTELKGVAKSGKGGLPLGKFCGDQSQVAAIDLNLDLQQAQSVVLNFGIRSNGDDPQPQDGIYFSDDGGQSFTKVHDLRIPTECDWYYKHPALDVDDLAAANGLNLTGEFVIRFQQYDNFSVYQTDGFFLDDVRVTRDTNFARAQLPYTEGFEQGLGPEWQVNTLDSQTFSKTVQPSVSGFAGTQAESRLPGVAHQGQKALTLGKQCGNKDVLNHADLHVDLSNATKPALTFHVKSNGDENHPQDGLWLSDDGGAHFTKVIGFQPESWCDFYHAFRRLDLKRLANRHGLNLTKDFVIRFQQRDNFPFKGGSEDGLYIDDIRIREAGGPYQSLPYQTDFEGTSLDDGWAIATPLKTIGNDTAALGPEGWAGLVDTGLVPVTPASGRQFLALGKRCAGKAVTNAADLKLDLSSATNPVLRFRVSSNEDATDSLDGIWFSDDGGDQFKKVLDFKPDGWCKGFHGFPAIPVKVLAQKAGLSLTDQFVIRFQQKGDDGFTTRYPDGILIDNLSVTEAQPYNYSSLPLNEGFENRDTLTGPWQVTNALTTKVDKPFPTGNGGLVAVWANSRLAGVAKDGQKALVMGRQCDGQLTTNAVDLAVRGNCSNYRLTFHIKRNFDNAQPADGIWVSQDGGQTFEQVYQYNYKRAVDAYHKTAIKLDTALGQGGNGLNDSLVIRFQQADNNNLREPSRDGLFFDNIRVRCVPTTGMADKGSLSAVKLYPNPVEDRLHIRLKGNHAPEGQLTIRNATGRVVLRQPAPKAKNHTLNTAGLPPGVYWLSMSTSKGQFVESFVKVRE